MLALRAGTPAITSHSDAIVTPESRANMMIEVSLAIGKFQSSSTLQRCDRSLKSHWPANLLRLIADIAANQLKIRV